MTRKKSMTKAVLVLAFSGAAMAESVSLQNQIGDVQWGVVLVVRADGPGFDLNAFWPSADQRTQRAAQHTLALVKLRLEQFLAEQRSCLNGHSIQEQNDGRVVNWIGPCKAAGNSNCASTD